MWLLRFLKKIFFFILFVAIVGIMMVVFFGSMWFNNNYDASTWNSMLMAGTPPTGAIDQWFGAGAWFTGVTEGSKGLSVIALYYVIPIGFSLVFGIIIYTALSLILHFIFRMFRRHKRNKNNPNRKIKNERRQF